MTQVTLYGRTYSDDGTAVRDMLNGGHKNWFFPLVQDFISLTSGVVDGAGKFTIDASGNLGLGVTPSAWGTGTLQRAIEMNGGCVWSFGNAVFDIGSNWYHNASSQFIYKNSQFATSYRQRSDNGQHQWYTAPSGTAGNPITGANAFVQTMTLDASGNLGIGTTSPGGWGKAVSVSNTTTDSGFTFEGSTRKWGIGGGFTDGALRVYDFTAGTERARITSGGDLLVGTTTAYGRVVGKGTGASSPGMVAIADTVSIEAFAAWNQATSGNNLLINFGTEASFTTRGSIDYNRAGGLTRYNTASDYRAKDIIGPVQDPGATIDALKVYEGQMKGATQSRPMLIAHEAQAHAPYAVSGVKDEVNEDGTPKFQQIDVSSLVPLLLAEIQSLRARVAALE